MYKNTQERGYMHMGKVWKAKARLKERNEVSSLVFGLSVVQLQGRENENEYI